MKKIALTLAIFLGMSVGALAQGGMFQYGFSQQGFTGPTWFAVGQNTWANTWNRDGGFNPTLPNHGEDTNQAAPLGSGALLLVGFGAAYALKKRNKK